MQIDLTFKEYNKEQQLLTPEYQKKLAHNNKYVKNYYKRGLDEVSPEDVLKELAEQGINRDISTLQRYAKAGLIPRPKIINKGRGRGKIAIYPEDTASQFVASYYTLQFSGKLVKDDVRKIRKIALLKLQLVKKGATLLHDDIVDCMAEDKIPELKTLTTEAKEIIYLLSLNWLLAYEMPNNLRRKGRSPLKDLQDFKKHLSYSKKIPSPELLIKTITEIRALAI